MSEKEAKFLRDVNDLIVRALRAGASVQSVKLVMQMALNDIEKAEPYIKAIAEKDLGP
jgi:Flp pilus assembly protein TadB